MTDQEKILFQSALERLLDSESIRHSSGLRSLLSYLGEQSLAGKGGELKEYIIGLEVFHKPSDYDPQEDPAVRVLASKLRSRLDEYYRKEDPRDPVRIELPKGHYELKFRLRKEEDAPVDAGRLRAEIKRWRLTSFALGLCLLVSLAAGGYWLYFLPPVNRAATAAERLWTPQLEAIWKPFLDPDRPVLISLGTPFFVKFSSGFYRDPLINDEKAAEQASRVRSLQEQLKSSFFMPWHGYTGTGEATAAFHLARLLNSRQPDLHLQRSNAVTWEVIRRNDLIFLGCRKYNPLLGGLPVQGDFVIPRGQIVNLQPRPGEQESYNDVWDPELQELVEDYALVSRLPGLHGIHGQTRIMVLESASTEGTWAAAEYVTQAAYASDLVRRLVPAGGELPDFFQVLLQVKFKNQVPTEIRHVAHRILQDDNSDSPEPPPS